MLRQLLLTIFLLQFILQVKAQLVAQFNTTDLNGCVPFSVTFQNTSNGATSYFWDFGNGSTSTAAQPSVVYQNPGIYTVKLIVSNLSGNADSLVRTSYINVSGLPQAGFSIAQTSGCPNVPFTFTNNSTTSTNWLWDFGDGTTSTQQNPVHNYSTPGNYIVTLVAGNASGCSDFFSAPAPITIYPQPNTAFQVSSSMLCSPGTPLQLTNDPGCTTVNWNFGDGISSTQQNPTHTYFNPGNYQITLQATNTFGCTSAPSSQQVLVKTPIVPSIFADDTSGCLPLPVHFSSAPNVNYTSWHWNFGNGDSSTVQNPDEVFSTAGNFNVTLTVNTIFGCIYQRTINSLIDIPQTPISQFNLTNSSGCFPLNVTFNNTSQFATSYLWEFGDGTTSTQANPSHIYNSNGVFTVKLHAYNADGCEQIFILNNAVQCFRAVPSITIQNASGCAPFNASFINQTQGGFANQYIWYFGDGTTSTALNPVHTYAIPGQYTVSLVTITPQGCRDSAGIQNMIHIINPAAGYVIPPPVSSCAPFSIELSDSTFNAINWIWNFGDGTTSTSQTVNHTYNNPGHYTVSLTIFINGGCTHHYPQFMLYEIGQAKAQPVISADCSSLNVNFEDTSSTSVSWNWVFGNGQVSNLQNPTAVLSGDLNLPMSLTVTDAEGCTDTWTGFNVLDYFVCGAPSGSSDPSTGMPMSLMNSGIEMKGCVPFEVHFFNPLPGTISFVKWNFGDGNSSANGDVTHTYTGTGTFSVEMIYSMNGVNDTITFSNLVKTAAISPGFTIANYPTCANPQLALSDASTGSLAWNYVLSGTSSSQQNPQVTFPSFDGNLSIIQNVNGQYGCHASMNQLYFASTSILASADDYSVCNGAPVHFYSTAQNFASYNWNFGDGTTSGLQSPVHSYAIAGSFVASISATTIGGCVYTASIPSAVVSYVPLANFSYTQPNSCSSTQVQFTNLSTGTPQPLASYSYWAPGNGSSFYGLNPVVNYPAPGVYNVTLTALGGGCTNVITIPVAVGKPDAQFSFSQDKTCFPVVATFTDQSVGAVSWLWNFGDGSTSTLQHPQHTFNSMPQAPISLIVYDSRGCSDTIVQNNISIFQTNAIGGNPAGCVPHTVSYSGNCPGTVAWNWNFGDGTTSTQMDPAHVFSTAGIFNPYMIGFANDGCSDTIFLSQVITEQPNVGFIADTLVGCAPHSVNFTNQSAGAVSYTWDFGDGGSSSSLNPFHLYTTPGIYSVKLIAISSNGCQDTLIRNQYIHVKGPVANFNLNTTSACAGSNIQCQDLSSGGTQWQWNFGDGASSNQQNPVHSYSQSGSFAVSLFVLDSTGCSAFFSSSAAIQILNANQGSVSIPDSIGCVPFIATLIDNSSGMQQSTWNFGDGTFSTVSNDTIQHTYTVPGNYQITLITTNTGGCSDTVITHHVFVNDPPQVTLNPSVLSGCSPLQVQFGASATSSIVNYNWQFGNGIQSNLSQPLVTFNSGQWNVSLIVTDANGCSDTISNTAYIAVADTLAPQTPQMKRVTVLNNTSVGMEWSASVSTDVDHYNVYRYNNTTGQYQNVAILPANWPTQFVDSAVNTLHQSWCYKITAVDTCGYESKLNQTNGHCTVELTAQTITATTTQLTWNPYGGAQVVTYEIYRKSPSENAFTLHSQVNGNVHQYIDTLSYCPGWYAYKVIAKNLNGTVLSSMSDTSMNVVSGASFTNVNGSIIRSTVFENSGVLTEWQLSPGVNHLVSGVELYRSNDNVTFLPLQTFPVGINAYLDNQVNVQEQNYFYKIKVLSVCETSSLLSDPSSSVLLKIDRVNEFDIKLYWTPYTEWNTGVEKYEIQRLDENGNWVTVTVVNGTTLQTVIRE